METIISTPAAHIIVVTFGSAGDLFPFLKLAHSLEQQGHRVTLLAPAPFAEHAGALDFHGLPADEGVLDDPDLWHPRKGFGVVWHATRPAMREMVRYVNSLPAGAPDLILAHPLALADADLCRARHPQLKVAAAYLAPSNLRTVHGPLAIGRIEIPAWLPQWTRAAIWRAGERLVLHPVALAELNRERANAGLVPVSSLLDHIEGLADLSVGLFPDWFGPAQPDWPQPFCSGGFPLHDPSPDSSLPTGLQAFLNDGDQPLVFTHGTGNRQARAYFRAAIGAAHRLGKRAILLTPDRQQLPDTLPANIWWQDYVPLRTLLAQDEETNVAALIHHGGIGTTAEALRAGVPQLIVPMAFDQFDNAARVRRLGPGHTLPATRVSEKTLANQLSRLLASPAIRSACKAARSRIAKGNDFKAAVAAICILVSKTGKN